MYVLKYSKSQSTNDVNYLCCMCKLNDLITAYPRILFMSTCVRVLLLDQTS